MYAQLRKAGLAVAAVTVVSGLVSGAAAFAGPQENANPTMAMVAQEQPVAQVDVAEAVVAASPSVDMVSRGSLDIGTSERAVGALKVEVGKGSVTTMTPDPEPEPVRSERSSRSNDRASTRESSTNNTNQESTRKTDQSEQPAASAPVPSDERQAALVAFVQGALGTPYRYGGTSSSGYDCSGLTMAAYRSVGIKIPRTSQAQFAAYPKVSKADLQPGDLVFYRGLQHVGMYVGNGKVIHATNPGNPVRYTSLNNTMSYDGAVRPG